MWIQDVSLAAGLRLEIDGRAVGSYTNDWRKAISVMVGYPGMEATRNNINHKTKIFRRVKKLSSCLPKTRSWRWFCFACFSLFFQFWNTSWEFAFGAREHNAGERYESNQLGIDVKLHGVSSSFDLNINAKKCDENSKQLQIKHQMRDENNVRIYICTTNAIGKFSTSSQEHLVKSLGK